MFNTVQWIGNYIAEGVAQLNSDMANFGGSPLSMRIAIQGSGTRYGSTTAVNLLAGSGQWQQVSFGLEDLSSTESASFHFLTVFRERLYFLARAFTLKSDFLISRLIAGVVRAFLCNIVFIRYILYYITYRKSTDISIIKK